MLSLLKQSSLASPIKESKSAQREWPDAGPRGRELKVAKARTDERS